MLYLLLAAFCVVDAGAAAQLGLRRRQWCDEKIGHCTQLWECGWDYNITYDAYLDGILGPEDVAEVSFDVVNVGDTPAADTLILIEMLSPGLTVRPKSFILPPLSPYATNRSAFHKIRFFLTVLSSFPSTLPPPRVVARIVEDASISTQYAASVPIPLMNVGYAIRRVPTSSSASFLAFSTPAVASQWSIVKAPITPLGGVALNVLRTAAPLSTRATAKGGVPRTSLAIATPEQLAIIVGGGSSDAPLSPTLGGNGGGAPPTPSVSALPSSSPSTSPALPPPLGGVMTINALSRRVAAVVVDSVVGAIVLSGITPSVYHHTNAFANATVAAAVADAFNGGRGVSGVSFTGDVSTPTTMTALEGDSAQPSRLPSHTSASSSTLAFDGSSAGFIYGKGVSASAAVVTPWVYAKPQVGVSFTTSDAVGFAGGTVLGSSGGGGGGGGDEAVTAAIQDEGESTTGLAAESTGGVSTIGGTVPGVVLVASPDGRVLHQRRRVRVLAIITVWIVSSAVAASSGVWVEMLTTQNAAVWGQGRGWRDAGDVASISPPYDGKVSLTASDGNSYVHKAYTTITSAPIDVHVELYVPHGTRLRLRVVAASSDPSFSAIVLGLSFSSGTAASIFHEVVPYNRTAATARTLEGTCGAGVCPKETSVGCVDNGDRALCVCTDVYRGPRCSIKVGEKEIEEVVVPAALVLSVGVMVASLIFFVFCVVVGGICAGVRTQQDGLLIKEAVAFKGVLEKAYEADVLDLADAAVQREMVVVGDEAHAHREPMVMVRRPVGAEGGRRMVGPLVTR